MSSLCCVLKWASWWATYPHAWPVSQHRNFINSSSSSIAKGLRGTAWDLMQKKFTNSQWKKQDVHSPAPSPLHTQCIRFPSWYERALSSWVCQIDCFCFSLLKSEREWWAVILNWISKSAFSSKWSLCYSQVKTRLMQIFQMHERIPNDRNGKFNFIGRMLACMQMVLFSFSNDLPLPCVCAMILHIPCSTSSFSYVWGR